tara:strand:- start:2880 stop:3119 length:240 start_codon:yes stop_codon:yes gene_type:complete
MNPFALGVLAPHMKKNPFGLLAGANEQSGLNPFLMEKERKEKASQASAEQVPWMQQPGMFGIDRQASMMGGLNLLMGGY